MVKFRERRGISTEGKASEFKTVKFGLNREGEGDNWHKTEALNLQGTGCENARSTKKI